MKTTLFRFGRTAACLTLAVALRPLSIAVYIQI